jgi:PTH2 family peptidyl-tRNA hydrolase
MLCCAVLQNYNNQCNYHNYHSKLFQLINMAAPDEDELAMYIIMNNDLGMGKGKLVSQGAHAACDVVIHLEQMCHEQTRLSEECIKYKKWQRSGYAKIVKKATQIELEELIELSKNKSIPRCFPIIDAGRTQIAPNSLTAIAFFPNEKSIMTPIVGKFKLL